MGIAGVSGFFWTECGMGCYRMSDVVGLGSGIVVYVVGGFRSTFVWYGGRVCCDGGARAYCTVLYGTKGGSTRGQDSGICIVGLYCICSLNSFLVLQI